MTISFAFSPEVEELRVQIRDFIENFVKPIEAEIKAKDGDRETLVRGVIKNAQGSAGPRYLVAAYA